MYKKQMIVPTQPSWPGDVNNHVPLTRQVEGLSGVSYRIQCWQYSRDAGKYEYMVEVKNEQYKKVSRVDIWLSDGATPPNWQKNHFPIGRGESYIYRDCWVPVGPDAAGQLKLIFQNFTAN